MPRFRKRPVIVEAQRYLPPHQIPASVSCDAAGSPYVVTIHGQWTLVADGDWIITEPDGVHHYPCKPDIFEATYEPTE